MSKCFCENECWGQMGTWWMNKATADWWVPLTRDATGCPLWIPGATQWRGWETGFVLCADNKGGWSLTFQLVSPSFFSFDFFGFPFMVVWDNHSTSRADVLVGEVEQLMGVRAIPGWCHFRLPVRQADGKSEVEKLLEAVSMLQFESNICANKVGPNTYSFGSGWKRQTEETSSPIWNFEGNHRNANCCHEGSSDWR